MLMFCNYFADFKTVEKNAQKRRLTNAELASIVFSFFPINDSPIVAYFSQIIDSPIVFLGQWLDNRWSDNPVAQ